MRLKALPPSCMAGCLAASTSKLLPKRMSPRRRETPLRRVPHVSILRHGIPFVSFLALTACRPHDFPQYDANYREYAYVTNGGSGTVSVYDVVNVRVDREIPV